VSDVCMNDLKIVSINMIKLKIINTTIKIENL